MLGSAMTWRVFGVCALLGGCDRLTVISAVDKPHELESETDSGEPPDQEEGERPDATEASTAPLDAAEDDGGPTMNMPLDAGRAMDASRPDSGPARDASGDGARPVSDAATDAMLPRCSGTRSLDLCWYLGSAGASCEQTCSGRGGFDGRAIGRLGTSAQGGTLDGCAQVLAALGYTGTVTPGYRLDGVGLGCHLWESDGWWLQMPDWSPAASISVASLACACLR